MGGWPLAIVVLVARSMMSTELAPEVVQERVELPPGEIVVGEAVKAVMVWQPATETVTCNVTGEQPEAPEAVSV